VTNTNIAQIITPREDDLATLADQINAEHAECKSAVIKGCQHAIACGKKLLRAKELLGHGRFGEWRDANTHVGERQGQRYMELAVNEQMLLAKAPNLRELTMTAGIKLMEQIKDPDESGSSGRGNGSGKPRTSAVDSAIKKDPLAVLEKAWKKCNVEQQQEFRDKIA
jgi:hypothetical protein